MVTPSRVPTPLDIEGGDFDKQALDGLNTPSGTFRTFDAKERKRGMIEYMEHEPKSGKRQHLRSNPEAHDKILVPLEDGLPSPSEVPLADINEERRKRYLQSVFQPRLNVIRKKAGLKHCGGLLKQWETVESRLREAAVKTAWINMMLRDFEGGHKVWDEELIIDPNLELRSFAHGFPQSASWEPAVPSLSLDLGDPSLVPSKAFESPGPTETERELRSLTTTIRTEKIQRPVRETKEYAPAGHENSMWLAASPTNNVPTAVKVRPPIGPVKEKLESDITDEERLLGRLGQERTELDAKLRMIVERTERAERRIAGKRESLKKFEALRTIRTGLAAVYGDLAPETRETKIAEAMEGPEKEFWDQHMRCDLNRASRSLRQVRGDEKSYGSEGEEHIQELRS